MSGFLNTSSLRAAKSNANYLFEGDFRRRPNQNLSGASRMVNRGQLLQDAALQRQDREDRRKRNDSAIMIQAVWRGYKCRMSLAQPMRLEFDHSLSNVQVCTDFNSLDRLFKTFLLYYHSKKDHERLLIINNLFEENQYNIINLKRVNPSVWNFRILKLLKINLFCLSGYHNKDGFDARHLTFIENFTRDSIMHTHEKSVAWKSLIQLKLFTILRNIIDQNTTDSIDDIKEANIHSTILEVTIRSIDSDDTDNHDPKGSFFTIFLRGPLPKILEDFYLPKLLEMKPKGLRPPALLDSYDKLMNKTVQLLPKLTKQVQILDKETMMSFIQATWLSFTFVKIIDSQINQLTDTDKCKYLNTLSSLITPIEQLFHFNSALTKLDDDSKNEDLDDNNPVHSNQILDPEQVIQYQNYSKDMDYVICKLVKLINCQTHVDNLRSILFNSECNSKVHAAIIKICNFTLAHEELAIFNCPLLYTIAFNWDFLRKLWKSITTTSSSSLFGHNMPIYTQITKGDASISSDSWESILPRLKLFCSIYSYLLPTLDDEEFYTNNDDTGYSSAMDQDQTTSGNNMKHHHGSSTSGTFFVDRELIGISAKLRDLCVGMIEIIYHENKYMNNTNPLNVASMIKFNIRNCFKAIVRLVCQIHARDSRKQFCPTGHWICPSAMVPTNKAVELHSITSQFGRLLDRIDDLGNSSKQSNTNIPRDIKGTLILQEIPFVIPFEQRVQMFHQLIHQEKRLNTSDGYFFGVPGHAITLQVRRNYIYEDAFRKLSTNNQQNMKSPFKVSLINAVGADEAGIDGGGVTKEFLSELLKAGFDPMRGFFKTTNDHQLYPNPSAKVLFSNLEDGYIVHYEFLGKMLGKALMEKVMVELPFASFFLAKILARSNQADVDWHNLASLDPIVYKNLVYLKNYDGDVADLNLDFTITNNELDEKETVELKPGGSKLPVTRSNRVEYVHLVADYRLNKQIRAQCAAFKKGLSELIDLDWLRMFDPREFQILISGTPVSIDIADWRRHTVYGNGYTDESEPVVTFWRVVNGLDESHKRKLLKFATSCSNPPLLGFRDLYPQFTIAPSEETRLPTASTCMNLLKLPQCTDDTTMRSKILYAIDSNSGFDLS